jgi:S-formylglutathione hydrolase FrmB
VESLDEVYKTKHPKFRTLFLLHGGVEDARSWLAYTNIEKYADKHNLAVVLPSVGNSFYADMKHGEKYWTYVSDELIRFVRSVFPLSEKREDNYVAGLSMGGYGAFKMALSKPELFSAGISLSGALDISSLFENVGTTPINLNNIFGSKEEFLESDNNLNKLIDQLIQNKVDIPKLYIACGLDDNLYESNKEFLRKLNSHSVDVTYDEGPGGHEWDFWDVYIKKAIEWLDNCN